MKKYLYLLLVGLTLSVCAKAAPGDTTWVQGNITYLDGYGSYDSLVAFPAKGKTYRQILMIFTLGKHACDGSVCGDWDYTVQNYLLVPGGDMLELGRLITPYANMSSPRTPANWQQRYVYDVTDYAPVLHDNAVMRIFYSGYTGGFTGNIKFAFIEGAPDREVLAVRRLWNGSFGYGGPISINANFAPVHDIAPEHTTEAALKFTVTGHGSDANGCCEFAPHSFDVKLNDRVIGSTTIWRDNCGLNQIYPQPGTWPINRANWCPGTSVNPYYYPLRGVTAGTAYSTAIEFEEYSGGGIYTTEAHVFFYGSMKKVLDASIDDIITPSDNENHFRENPCSGSPVIHVKNRGKSTIDSITFQYGLSGALTETYTWKTNLKPLQEADVTLPVFAKLISLSDSAKSDTANFTAKIALVNGEGDGDNTNNVMSSQFVSVPQWPTTFRIHFLPNNQATVLKPGISETSWAIFDMNNNIVKQRINAPISAMQVDTVSLPSGSYRLELFDSSCDGLNWWFHGQINDGVSSGSFFVRKTTGTNIPMKGYVYVGTFAHDFGCGFTQYFTVSKPAPAIVNNILGTELEMHTFPNPAQNMVQVEVTGMEQIHGTIQIIDALGRVASETACNESHKEINVSALLNGVYTVQFINKESGNRLVSRLLIAK